MPKMVNEAKMMEKRAVDAVRVLLGNVPNVEFGPMDYGHDLGRNCHIDGRICLGVALELSDSEGLAWPERPDGGRR